MVVFVRWRQAERCPRLTAGLLALLGAGCSAGLPVAEDETPVTVARVAGQSGRDVIPAPNPRSVASTICGTEPGCHELAQTPAGKNAAGQALTLHIIHRQFLGDSVEQDALDPNGGWSSAKNVHTILPDHFGECHPIEYWLKIDDASRAPLPTHLLTICNDGYGASGVGEDTVTISNNRLVHEVYGGSAWRWYQGTEVTLSPLQLVRATSGGHWTFGPNTSDSTWRYEALDGTHRWFSPNCGELEEPENDDGVEYATRLIPQIELDSATLDDGWLDACAARLGGPERLGFHVSAAEAVPTAELRLVVTKDNMLVIDLRDDILLTEDRIVLSTSSEGVDYTAHCLDKLPTPSVWEIRPLHASIAPITPTATQTLPTVTGRLQRDQHGSVQRLVVSLPLATTRVRVAYSDVDALGRAAQVWATSSNSAGDYESLGPIEHPPNFTCAMHEGQLQIDRLLRSPESGPVLGAL